MPPLEKTANRNKSASHNELIVAIQRLKNNKAAPNGRHAEFLTAGGNELVSSIHELICRIWLEESICSD